MLSRTPIQGAAVLTAAWCLTLVESSWSNNLGGMLSRSCMYGFGISSIHSEYHENGGDRLWEIGCSRIGLLRGDDVCIWTYDFVNEPTQKIKYDCGENQYVAGLYSDYNGTLHDRVWRIECCESPGVRVVNCQTRDWANKYTENLELDIGTDRVIKGMTSVYKDDKSDRKWRFTVCDAQKKQSANDGAANSNTSV